MPQLEFDYCKLLIFALGAPACLCFVVVVDVVVLVAVDLVVDAGSLMIFHLSKDLVPVPAVLR